MHHVNKICKTCASKHLFTTEVIIMLTKTSNLANMKEKCYQNIHIINTHSYMNIERCQKSFQNFLTSKNHFSSDGLLFSGVCLRTTTDLFPEGEDIFQRLQTKCVSFINPFGIADQDASTIHLVNILHFVV